jgi:hypothetical protein
MQYQGWNDYWVIQRNRKFTQWLSILLAVIALVMCAFVAKRARAAEPDAAVMLRPWQFCRRRVDKYSHRRKWCWNTDICYKSRQICNRSLTEQLQFERSTGAKTR